jgi:NAD(P)-dependent dehydrogenase (short-subunit alcohol dehydrogenase family)
MSGPLDRFRLDDRVAVITGGSRGIGLATAKSLAAVGASVVVASRKADACEAAVEEIAASGGTALAVPTHVGRVEDIERLVEQTIDRLGRLDIVVNNAANPLAQPFGSITPEAMAKSWEVNLRGPALLTQAAMPHLAASGHGSVVNVITAGVFTHGTYVSLYISAKAALQAMTRAMAAELAPQEIRVNALAPGTVRTEMVTVMPEEFQASAVDAQLIKRMADPEEIAMGVLFLASDASSFMTGQTLVLDGGMTTS